MTESDIQNLIASTGGMIGPREVMVPNCGTVFSWEADLLAVVPRSLYVEEYEIKCSRADFLRDRPKYGPKATRWRALTAAREGKDYRTWTRTIPNRFYYVVVEGEVEESEIPDYAGFFEVRSRLLLGGDVFLSLHRRRRAPVLHRGKVEVRAMAAMARGVSLRLWDVRRQLRSAKRELERLEDAEKDLSTDMVGGEM